MIFSRNGRYRQTALFLFCHLLLYVNVRAADTPSKTDSMRVQAIRPADKTRIEITRIEEKIGFLDDFNTILRIAPTLIQKPETGSLFMVKGESPYDNMLLLNNLLLFMPAHFSGQTYLDRSMIPVSVPAQIDLYTGTQAGVFSGASGSIISVTPGFIHTPRLIPRPELMINYGTIGADLTLTTPFRKGDDTYQLTLRPADAYTIKANELMYGNNYSRPPASYGDLQFLGEQNRASLRTTELLWISNESYAGAGSMTSRLKQGASTPTFSPQQGPTGFNLTSGIAAITINDTGAGRNRLLSIGGSRQYHYTESLFSKVVERRNAALTAGENIPVGSLGMMSLRFQTEIVQWKGTITGWHDSLFYWSADPAKDLERSGITVTTGIHAGLSGGAADWSWGFNCLPALFWPGPRAAVDPGLWAKRALGRGTMTFAGGIISTQPDVRGMPESGMMTRLQHTYQAQVSLASDQSGRIRGAIDGYGKWKDHLLREGTAPQLPIWDNDPHASLTTAGISGTLNADLGKHTAWITVASLSRSMAHDDNGWSEYVWNVPWSISSTLKSSFLENRLNTFLIGNASANLPLDTGRELSGALDPGWSIPRHDPYVCLDVKAQFDQPIGYHRFLRQFGVYILVDNLLGIGEFISPGGHEFTTINRPVEQKPFAAHIGVRVWLRL